MPDDQLMDGWNRKTGRQTMAGRQAGRQMGPLWIRITMTYLEYFTGQVVCLCWPNRTITLGRTVRYKYRYNITERLHPDLYSIINGCSQKMSTVKTPTGAAQYFFLQLIYKPYSLPSSPACILIFYYLYCTAPLHCWVHCLLEIVLID